MNTTQKDPSQYIATEDRHDQARKHRIISSLLTDADLEFVASKEIQLIEGLEARLHQKINDVIEIIKKAADGIPSAQNSARVIDLLGGKSIL